MSHKGSIRKGMRGRRGKGGQAGYLWRTRRREYACIFTWKGTRGFKGGEGASRRGYKRVRSGKRKGGVGGGGWGARVGVETIARFSKGEKLGEMQEGPFSERGD